MPKTRSKTRSRSKKSKSKGKKGKKGKKYQKGGAYGNTMNSMNVNANGGMGYGYSGPVKYNHCGGSKANVAIFNNRVGYGYTAAGAQMAGDVQGSYAPVSRYVGSQCGAGKRKKRKKSRKNKSRKSRKHVKKSKKNKKKNKRRTKKRRRKHKGKKHHQKGGSGYSQYLSGTPVGTSYESPVVNPPLNALGPLSVNKTNINCTDNYNHYKK